MSFRAISSKNKHNDVLFSKIELTLAACIVHLVGHDGRKEEDLMPLTLCSDKNNDKRFGESRTKFTMSLTKENISRHCVLTDRAFCRKGFKSGSRNEHVVLLAVRYVHVAANLISCLTHLPHHPCIGHGIYENIVNNSKKFTCIG